MSTPVIPPREPIYYSSSDSDVDDDEGCTKNDQRTIRDGGGSDYGDGPNEHERDDQQPEEDDDRRPGAVVDGHRDPGDLTDDQDSDCVFWRRDNDPGQGFYDGTRQQAPFNADGVFSEEHKANITKHLPASTKIPWAQEPADFQNERFCDLGTEPRHGE